MRIICFARSLTLGGAERQIAGLAVMLQQEGHQVEVVTYHDDDFYEDYLKRNEVKHTLIPKKNNHDLIRKIAAHFESEKPDVVIAFLIGPATKACKAHKIWPHFKLIVSERNVNLKCQLHDIWRFRLFSEADSVIANSHAQQEFMDKHAPWLRNKLGCIVNFVDTDRFTPSAEPISNPIPVLATTARVHKRKNILGYIHAAKILKERGERFIIRWYGLSKEDSYSNKCNALIAKYNLQDCFEILPARKDVENIYRSCDIFCLPSFYEGTPNSLCEALSCGRPAAASSVSDNALYVRKDKNGVTFNPKDPNDIADALQSLLQMPSEQLQAYGKESRKIAEELLSKKRFISEYLSLIKDLQ